MQSALDRIGVGKARFYAQWSTVNNPFGNPRYAVPYGFVQSPILASLVIATSELGQHLLKLPISVNVAVYVDDISLSSNDVDDLQQAYDMTLVALAKDGFAVSVDKLRCPSPAIDIFNCDLSHGEARVKHERANAFFMSAPSKAAEEAFIAYCATVEAGNRL